MIFPQRIKTPSKHLLKYGSLEPRQLLAVSSTFDSGNLTVDLTENGDAATIDIVDGFVTVNGNQVDIDTDTAGIQPAGINDILELSFVAPEGLTNISAELNGAFNDGSLQSLVFTNINDVTLNGTYTTTTLFGQFVGTGMFSGNGELQVIGPTNIQSNDAFDVALTNVNNDFMGQISASTLGSIELSDSSDIILNQIDVNELILNAEGLIGEAMDANVRVGFLTDLTAANINLGNMGESVDLFVVIANTPGTFALNEATGFVWANFSTVGFANLQAAEFITMGRSANITVTGDAMFSAQSIRLGVGGSNSFNAGRINLNSTGNSFVWENSNLELFGDNQVADLDLIVTGNITNSAGAAINVDGIASVQAVTSVSLGNAPGDSFNTGFFQFFASEVNVSEDSDTVISGLANFANNLLIQSNGMIVDTFNAFILVQENGTFISQGVDDVETGVVLGDSQNDFFVAGSISFNVNNFGLFVLTENDGTVIASNNGFVNSAEAISITASQSIVNGNEANIDIRTTAVFAASSITIGQAENDDIQFGSITMTTGAGGNATIVEDSDMFLTGVSNIGGDLVVNSLTGSLLDSNTSILNVAGQANFFANEDIIIGDLPAPTNESMTGDIFDASTLRFVAGGNVEITENGNMVLGDGVHRGQQVELTAAGSFTDMGEVIDPGNITNQDNAEFTAFGNLLLIANGDISLGNADDDAINFNNLNFSSPGSVDITAIFEDVEDEIFIFGTDSNPNSADQFKLETNVDVLDGTFAVIDIESMLEIDARNITLGDTETDCLMYPEGSIFTTSDQAPNVSPADETCPA